MSRQRHNQKMLSTTTPSLSKDEVLKCTGQKDNFLQFARLIMVAGTRLFRDLFNHLCPPEILPRKLSSLVEKLPRLNRHELKCLYPSRERCVTSDDFDISLLFKLLRVIVVEEPDGGWDELPKESDHKISDELVRIKYYRNEICHSCYNQEISDESFFELWEYIKGAMIGIAKQLPEGIEPWESAIDGLLKYPITSVEEQSEKELIEWYFRDMELKKELQEVKNVCNQIYMGVKKLLKGMFNFFLNNSNIRKCDNPPQCAKKVVSDSPWLVYFAIGLVVFVLNLPSAVLWGNYRRIVINPVN